MSRKEELRGRESRLQDENEALKKELALEREKIASMSNAIKSMLASKEEHNRICSC